MVDWQRSVRLILAVCAVWLVHAAPAGATPIAATSYDFTGNCENCTGTGQGVLTLSGYTPGDVIGLSNFLSFSYTSDRFSYSFGSGELVGVAGGLASPMPSGLSDLILNLQHASDPEVTFYSNGGYWSLGPSSPPPTADFGYSGGWSVAASVPEPISLALFGSGLVCLGVARRRRR